MYGKGKAILLLMACGVQNPYVNGVDQGQCSFASTAEGVWKELNLGTVKLTAGDNTIAMKGSWGWTNFDYLTVEEATLPDITASDTTLQRSGGNQADGLDASICPASTKAHHSGQQEFTIMAPTILNMSSSTSTTPPANIRQSAALTI